MEQYLKSPRKRFARQVKSYIVDIGLAKLFTDIDKGRALENAVFIELLRRKKAPDNIYYLKLRSGKEIDFVVGWKSTKLIQVCYEISSNDVKNRETSALVEAAKALKLKEGTVITYDYGGIESIDGIKIVYLPFWEWAIT